MKSAAEKDLQKEAGAYTAPVSRHVSGRELRKNSSSLLRDVQRGETLIITRNGAPVAELRPLPSRRFVPRAVIARAALVAPRIDRDLFRSDVDAIIGI